MENPENGYVMVINAQKEVIFQGELKAYMFGKEWMNHTEDKCEFVIWVADNRNPHKLIGGFYTSVDFLTAILKAMGALLGYNN